MGRLSSTGTRRLLRMLALSGLAIGGLATWALAAGPGGWDHLGDRGTAGSDSLNVVASALEATPSGLYVGGEFTDAGGVANADRIAKWDGSSWSAVSSSTEQIENGRVSDIAVSGTRVYAGGTFTNAGDDPEADYLAVWDGATWEPFCDATGPAFGGNVTSLQIIGSTLYVGGSFQDGAGIPSADYLLACDLTDGASRTTITPGTNPFAGSVYALAADSNDTLYAGGSFTNLEDDLAADNVAYLPAVGTWQAMGGGGGACDCAVTGVVRGLATIGDDAYIGSDANDISGLLQADHVARWDGSEWSAVGAGSGGGNGWFPTTTSINAMTSDGVHLFVTGLFADANGEAQADNVAWFDGTEWAPVGSNGAGDGPWSGTGLALAIVGRQLYATGSFTSAGGDTQAQFAASFHLSQIIAYPTPTVTPGPSAQPTPTVTPGPAPQPTPTVTPSPTPAPRDVRAPRTLLRAARINQAQRKATFRFASGERGSTFRCKLDRQRFKACTSPKTYKKLKRGKHVFRVKARDRAGNVDRTPIVKRFKIKR